MRYIVTSTWPRLQKLHLKPGLDPKDPDLKPLIAQAMYIHQHAQEFYDYVESRLLEKILKDICYIYHEKWCDEISQSDFFHGHISGKSEKPIFNMDDLFSPNNIFILYHTHDSLAFLQHWKSTGISVSQWPKFPTKNILSSSKSQPVVIQPKPNKYAVDVTDLNLMYYADVYFEQDHGGSYKLEDGTTLDVWGVLLTKNILINYLEK